MKRKDFVAEFTRQRKALYAAEPDRPHKVAEDLAGMLCAGPEALELWEKHRAVLRGMTVTGLRLGLEISHARKRKEA